MIRLVALRAKPVPKRMLSSTVFILKISPLPNNLMFKGFSSAIAKDEVSIRIIKNIQNLFFLDIMGLY